MENTDEQFHAWQEKAIKNRWKLSRVWYGPLWGGIEIHHPDLIKHILKGKALISHHAIFLSNNLLCSSQGWICLPVCRAMARSVMHSTHIAKNEPSPSNLHCFSTGKGLLIANGAKWFRNRRLLTPAFHFEILKPYVQVYNDCTAILLVRTIKLIIGLSNLCRYSKN